MSVVSGSDLSANHVMESDNTRYMRQLMMNVFACAGYKHLVKYLKREGKSKISLPKVIKAL